MVGFTQVGSNGSNGLWTTSGSAAATDSIVSSALTNLASSTTASPFPVTIPTGTSGAPERYNVNLPVSSPAGSIALGVLSKKLPGRSRAVGRAGGRPRRGGVVAARDHRESDGGGDRARNRDPVPAVCVEWRDFDRVQESGAVAQGEAADHARQTGSFSTSTSPTIRSARSSSASGGVNVPAIDTRAIKTQVLVNDGQTVVLGGILDTNRTENVTKVPYLGDIPILGNLFKTTTRTNNKDELLIFVTPKILREGVNTY